MKEKDIVILREYEMFRRREYVQPHMSYAHERQRLRIITEGRVDLIDEIMEIPPDGTQAVLSTNKLRSMKNAFIASVTLFTRAAIEGGLAEEVAFSMSDSFIQNCENCVDFDELDVLYKKAFRKYTEMVAKKGRHYSQPIEEAIRYVHIHLHECLALNDISEAIGISACYLSRMFKKETGMSIVDYIQKERTEAAAHMLVYLQYSAAQISEYLHFSSQSYFIRIFKKHYGMTPAVYRKHYREKGEW